MDTQFAPQVEELQVQRFDSQVGVFLVGRIGSTGALLGLAGLAPLLVPVAAGPRVVRFEHGGRQFVLGEVQLPLQDRRRYCCCCCCCCYYYYCSKLS